jgi:NADPH2:quinone reductase
MRAVMCRALGEPEDLVVEDLDTVPCGLDQVRVRIWSSGVNYVDALFVQGRYQIKPALPFIPGSEIAGEITEVGPAVEGWAVGDRVMASIGLGGFADEAVLRPEQLTRIPDNLTFGQAATMGQSYCTAWFTLTRRTVVRPEDWVVIYGAAGGVGLAMLDVARSFGAHTVAVASTPEKLQLAIERNANAVIDSSVPESEAGSMRAQIREITGGGADVVIDPVGGPLAEEGLRGLREGGRLMVIGFASGEIPSLPANQVLLRNRSVLGVDWGAWALGHPQENAALLDEVLGQVAAGPLSPIEPTTMPLEDVGVALRDLLERRVVGKLALESRAR